MRSRVAVRGSTARVETTAGGGAGGGWPAAFFLSEHAARAVASKSTPRAPARRIAWNRRRPGRMPDGGTRSCARDGVGPVRCILVSAAFMKDTARLPGRCKIDQHTDAHVCCYCIV